MWSLFPLTRNALLILAAFLIALYFCSCAGSKADRDFRSKVQSDTTSVQVSGNAGSGDMGGTVTNTIVFRDPSK